MVVVVLTEYKPVLQVSCNTGEYCVRCARFCVCGWSEAAREGWCACVRACARATHLCVTPALNGKLPEPLSVV